MKYCEPLASVESRRIIKKLLIERYAAYLSEGSDGYTKLLGVINRIFHAYRRFRYNRLYEKFVYNNIEYIDKTSWNIKQMPKIAIYTCIVGDYDTIKEPIFVSEDCDYYIVTDKDVPLNSTWHKIDISSINETLKIDDPSLKNRWVKMHPHILFPDYDFTIYVDGSILITSDLIPLVLNMNEEMFLGLHVHPFRKTIYREAEALVTLGKINDVNLLKKQILKYRQEGFTSQMPLFEATVIVSRVKCELCKSFYEVWWDETMQYVHRDQISLPYVLWKNKISRDRIEILGDNILLNSRFILEKHK